MTSPRSLLSLVRELIEHIDRQRSLVVSSTQTLRAQRQQFITHRGTELEKLGTELEGPASELADIERSRRELQHEIAQRLGTDPWILTASAIAAAIHGPEAEHLRNAAERARQAATELKIESGIGERLLAWSARCHEGFLEQLCGLTAGDKQYGPDGKARRAASDSHLLDATL